MTRSADVTIRSLIRDIQIEVRDTDLQPDRGADLLAKLSALYGNVLDEVRVAEQDYNTVLLQCLHGDEAANRARIRAQATPQHARFREAKDTEKLALELIRSLKHFLRSKAEEMRLAR
jgi:hypothetical protein